MASVCVALNAIFVKKVLPALDGDMWRLTGYNNMNAVLLFLPIMWAMGEVPVIVGSGDVYDSSYWGMMTLAGLFGIAIGLVTMLQIRVTSPLTHNISGTSKVRTGALALAPAAHLEPPPPPPMLTRRHWRHWLISDRSPGRLAGLRPDHPGAAGLGRVQVGRLVAQQPHGPRWRLRVHAGAQGGDGGRQGTGAVKPPKVAKAADRPAHRGAARGAGCCPRGRVDRAAVQPATAKARQATRGRGAPM